MSCTCSAVEGPLEPPHGAVMNGAAQGHSDACLSESVGAHSCWAWVWDGLAGPQGMRVGLASVDAASQLPKGVSQLEAPPQPRVRVLAAPHPRWSSAFPALLILAVLVGTGQPCVLPVVCICRESFDSSHAATGGSSSPRHPISYRPSACPLP